jgi:hypothetical protein
LIRRIDGAIPALIRPGSGIGAFLGSVEHAIDNFAAHKAEFLSARVAGLDRGCWCILFSLLNN